jgi:hypothetical protein
LSASAYLALADAFVTPISEVHPVRDRGAGRGPAGGDPDARRRDVVLAADLLCAPEPGALAGARAPGAHRVPRGWRRRTRNAARSSCCVARYLACARARRSDLR